MRRLILCSCFVFISVCFNAQPVLTSNGVCPMVGDALQERIAYHEPIGGAGPNVIWNHSGLVNFTLPCCVPYSVIAPSSTLHASHFPSSNTVRTFGFTGLRDFLKVTPSVFQYFGSTYNNSINNAVILSDPEDLLRFPFTYGDSYTDSWEGKTNSGTDSIYRKGTSTVTADGYGTLILPQDTVTALRVFRLVTYRDSVFYGTPSITNSTLGTYEWWVQGVRHFAASESTTPGSYFVYINNLSNILEIEEKTEYNDFTIFPNPAQDHINVIFGNIISVTSLELIDVQGIIVSKASLSNSQNNVRSIEIPTSHLAPGLYYLRLYSSNSDTFYRKIIVID